MAVYSPDRLFAPDAMIRSVAEAGHTPFYLYNGAGIRQSVAALHQGFQWMPGYQNYFPLRKNLNPHLLTMLAKAGTGVSVTCLAELEHACACGFSGNQLLYEPTQRDDAATTLAMEQGAVWLLNTRWLLPETPPEQVILRYNPCELSLSPPIRQAVMRSKNGLNRQQLLQTAAELAAMGVGKLGLALQVSSYSLKPGFWQRKAAILLELAQEVRQRTGVTIACCQIGEAAGLSYHPKIAAPTLEGEIAQVRTLWSQLPEEQRPTILTAVSSRLLEPHGILVAKVLEVRSISRTFLILDAGSGHYCRPMLKQAYRHVSVLGKRETEGRRLYSLAGQLPDSLDRVALKGRMLPPVEPGDYCIVHDVGCGGRSIPVLYGLRPVAAEFLYEPESGLIPIAPGRSPQEVLRFLTGF